MNATRSMRNTRWKFRSNFTSDIAFHCDYSLFSPVDFHGNCDENLHRCWFWVCQILFHALSRSYRSLPNAPKHAFAFYFYRTFRIQFVAVSILRDWNRATFARNHGATSTRNHKAFIFVTIDWIAINETINCEAFWAEASEEFNRSSRYNVSAWIVSYH